MRYERIDIVARDENGFEEYRRDFETVKAAVDFVKQACLTPAFWDRRAELEGYHKKIVKIELVTDGEINRDWEPHFA